MLDPVSAESFQFFSLNQPVLSRAFMLLALAALLERDPPTRRAWLPWAVLGILTHEQASLLAPLWVLCLLHRDGVKKTLAQLRSRHGITVLALCLGYLALRFALRHSDPNLPHALSLRAVPQKWARVIGHVRGFAAFHTGFGTTLGNVPLQGFLSPNRSLLHTALMFLWLVVLGAWAVSGPRRQPAPPSPRRSGPSAATRPISSRSTSPPTITSTSRSWASRSSPAPRWASCGPCAKAGPAPLASRSSRWASQRSSPSVDATCRRVRWKPRPTSSSFSDPASAPHQTAPPT